MGATGDGERPTATSGTFLSGGHGQRPAVADQRELDAEEREQHELVRPPGLNQEAHRSSTRLELFSDLAFVLFVAQTADLLAEDASWSSAATFAALLTVGWWSWASGTLHANRFDTDDVAFRALTLLGTAGVVAMAASVAEVSGPTGRWFAVGYTLVRLGLVLGYLRAWRHVPAARPSIRPYLAGHSLGGAIWLVSAFVPVPARFALWGVGLVVDLATPALAARTRSGVPLHVEHLPERFALFMILVLGESVAGVVTGLHDGAWAPLVVVTAALAFLMTATVWWLYFDFSGGAAKRRLLEDEDEDDGQTKGGVHDLYLYAHLPVVIGLAGLAVGAEHAVLHGADLHLEPGARAVLGGGLALYLASTAVLQASLSGRTRAALLWPGGGVPLVLLATWADLRPPVLLAVLCGVLLAGLVAGVVEQRAGLVRTAKV